jgi:hypothetical protein
MISFRKVYETEGARYYRAGSGTSATLIAFHEWLLDKDDDRSIRVDVMLWTERGWQQLVILPLTTDEETLMTAMGLLIDTEIVLEPEVSVEDHQEIEGASV